MVQPRRCRSGHRLNLPLTAQRILAVLFARCGQVVSYDELFEVVKNGRNRDAFREIDPGFACVENIPMRGFRWADTESS